MAMRVKSQVVTFDLAVLRAGRNGRVGQAKRGYDGNYRANLTVRGKVFLGVGTSLDGSIKSAIAHAKEEGHRVSYHA